jgi:hypothetical protein
LQNLIDALRASGRPLPSVFSVHVSTWWSPTGAHVLYGLRQEDATLTANGLSQPLIVSETVYDDPEEAQAIEEFRRTSSRPVLEVQEWPLRRGSACQNFSAAPPFRADAYIEALTGRSPDRTITATLTAAGKVTLVAPYGGRATALVADRYTLVVTDASHTRSFRIVGPGVRLQTRARTRETTTSHVELRRGTYSFGAGPKLHYRLVVI